MQVGKFLILAHHFLIKYSKLKVFKQKRRVTVFSVMMKTIEIKGHLVTNPHCG